MACSSPRRTSSMTLGCFRATGHPCPKKTMDLPHAAKVDRQVWLTFFCQRLPVFPNEEINLEGTTFASKNSFSCMKSISNWLSEPINGATAQTGLAAWSSALCVPNRQRSLSPSALSLCSSTASLISRYSHWCFPFTTTTAVAFQWWELCVSSAEQAAVRLHAEVSSSVGVQFPIGALCPRCDLCVCCQLCLAANYPHFISTNLYCGTIPTEYAGLTVFCAVFTLWQPRQYEAIALTDSDRFYSPNFFFPLWLPLIEHLITVGIILILTN